MRIDGFAFLKPWVSCRDRLENSEFGASGDNPVKAKTGTS